ncbi:MAG TPA: glycosyltransferase [Planctomycetota bacterium]|jgi:GT2 family glycosyltransferase|nr:glycosyltransferase [Planctomycetota bacterium]
MQPPRISVVLPTLNRPEAIYNLLRHLEHQTTAPHEIVIVDQSPVLDERVAAYVAGKSGIRHHRIAERGLPNARNVGVGLASGDVVLFLDDDSIPDPDLIRYHAEAYADRDVSGVGGRVQGGYDAGGGVIGRFRESDGKVVRNFGATTRCAVDHLPGGNMSFRRDVFSRVDGFDKTYGGSAIGEETDFCLRARRAGFRFVFEPRAALEHLHLPTGGCRAPRFEDWLYWHSHNSVLFVLRHAHRALLPLFFLKRTLRLGLFAMEHGSLALIAVGLKGFARGIAAYRATR